MHPPKSILCANLALLGCLHAALASAEAPLDSDLPQQTLTHAELQSMRGGLRVGGLELEFAVVVRTHADGVLLQELASVFKPATSASSINISEQRETFIANYAVAGSNANAISVLSHVDEQRIVSLLVGTASHMTITREVDVQLKVRNFSDVAVQQMRAAIANLVARDGPGR